ncbi:OmpA family protein [Sediminibacterium ginsengisoli]|uniref:WD40-like Beta Propeller Repeat n=1 Tax=Sediminibacterium ginsengisoli TaxID=413434 RepID=A0A1T4K7M0_9BACT|nr:OmpA family protein [Sediminibacterium ginsengisoli]SJZ38440.1 WD40-like Beta Propeller Repeat [Sediminibacterium ginsengisoli]
MKALFFCIGLFFSGMLFSQGYDPGKVKPKASALYEKALDLLQAGAFTEAIPLLTDCIRIDSTFLDAYLSLAGACGELKKYQQSVTLYEKVRARDNEYFKVYNLPYSINLAGLGRFEEALNAVSIFEAIPNISERGVKSAAYRRRCYEFAIAYAKTHPATDYAFSPVNLGDSVNSAKSEYYPSVTVTDNQLVFTRKTGAAREDFFESDINKKGFGASHPINGTINIEPLKGAITVSQDGEWLLFAGYFGTGFGNYDLYISYYTPEGWSEPQNLGPSINTEFWESSPSLSPDKRALYFSSNRPGGSGGRDLYVSYRKPNGQWSEAVNMGPDINSAGDDFAPFIHADNQTLYYHSDGLPGYGGSDLFLVRKDLSGKWGKPENLGYPINTIENEGSLAVSADGLTAYYASDRSDSRGGLDLYKFSLRPDIRPYRTLYVKGKVIDSKTGKPLPSNVELTDNSSSNALMNVQTDELGEYFITLPTGRDYTFTVNRKGYLFYSEHYALSRQEPDSTYKKDIYLQPVALNASFIFSNIRFASNSYELPSEGLVELEKLVQVLKENPTLKVEISGHTDNIGKEDDNLLLSTNRAKSIVDYLVAHQIAAARLTYKGYGASKPIADNTTEGGRAQNRRTAFTVTGM